VNILEAYKLMKEGEIIRIQSKDDIYFVLETTLIPFNDKKIVKITLGHLGGENGIPENFSDLHYDDVTRVCVELIASEGYQQVSFEEMMSEIQSYCRKEQESEQSLIGR
jgi:hypothetical protein